MRWLCGSILLGALGPGLGCGGKASDPSIEEFTGADPGAAPQASSSRPSRGAAPNVTRPPRGEPSTGAAAPMPDEVPPSQPTIPALAQGQVVIQEFCGSCHGAEAVRAGNVQSFGDIEDLGALVARGWIVPLRSSESLIVEVMLDGSMPPPGVEPRPTSIDIESVIQLIDNPLLWPSPEPPPMDAGTPAVFADAGADAG